jgi:ribose transport system permease protein
MLLVLLLLCVFFSFGTMAEHDVSGAEGAEAILKRVRSEVPAGSALFIATRGIAEDTVLSHKLHQALVDAGYLITGRASGEPSAIRQSLSVVLTGERHPQAIVASPGAVSIVSGITAQLPGLESIPVITAKSSSWPTFLLADNIRNVANQIAVIAIIAIGMTMVIIAGGIDLSVGSLIALSAVLTAWLIGAMGGAGASTSAMLLASVAAILLCGLTGIFSGIMITSFGIPPFIATLAIMQVAAGVAYIVSQGVPIYQIPDSFVWLGRGADPLLRIPYAVILMAALYVAAHVLMTRTTFGRYVYAVGGNAEAARLAGIRTQYIQWAVYTVSAALAGLGGVVMASQLKSGAPTYGAGYELNVIAAVVVGGTSLSGGEGRIIGTLIGALVIGVIQNGMNLTNVESYTQKVVLGLVILGAVLLDQLKHRGFTRFLRRQLAR